MKNFLKRLINSIKVIIQRLNFFDILTFLALLIVLVILLKNYFQKKAEWIDLRLLVQNADWWYKGEKPAFWYAGDLAEGDVAYDSFGNEVAKINSIENYDLGEDGRAIYANLRVKANFDKKRQQYFYEFKPLLVGAGVIFNFDQEQLRGLVIGLGKNATGVQVEEKTVKLRINLILPELADQVQVGVRVLDGSKKVIAEILAVDNQMAQYYDFSDIRGQKILIYDPAYRLLFIDLKMKAFRAFDEYYYVDGTPLKVGQLFDLHFANFVLSNVEIIAVE